MPSNKDLIKEINSLTEELNYDRVDTDGKTNAELAELVSDLKAKKKDAELTTEADNVQPVIEKVATSKGNLPPYEISEGKSLTTMRGILVAGDEITTMHLSGDEDQLKLLVEKGYVTKN